MGGAMKIIDEWSVRGEHYRLLDIGAGPYHLEVSPELGAGEDWHPEQESFVHTALCERLEFLINSFGVGQTNNN